MDIFWKHTIELTLICEFDVNFVALKQFVVYMYRIVYWPLEKPNITKETALKDTENHQQLSLIKIIKFSAVRTPGID